MEFFVFSARNKSLQKCSNALNRNLSRVISNNGRKIKNSITVGFEHNVSQSNSMHCVLARQYFMRGHAKRHLSMCTWHKQRCVNVFLPNAGLKTNPIFDIRNPHILESLGVVPTRQYSFDSFQKYVSPDFPPIGLAQSVLENVHDVSGMPWWLTIAVVTVGMRAVVTTPLTIFSARNMYKAQLVRQELLKIAAAMKEKLEKEQYQFNWSEKLTKLTFKHNMDKIRQDLYLANNCHPLRPYVFMFGQLFIWLSMSFALRNMSGMPILGLETNLLCPDLATEGILWFPSLLLPDVTLVMPFLLGIINLINVEISFLSPKTLPVYQKVFLYLMRAGCLYMCFISMYVPTSLSLYWLCSSAFGLTQNCLLRVAKVRAVLGMPYMRKVPADQQQKKLPEPTTEKNLSDTTKTTPDKK